jgi:hypothetical protein
MLGVAKLERSESTFVSALLFCVVQAQAIFGVFPLPGDMIVAVTSNWGP